MNTSLLFLSTQPTTRLLKTVCSVLVFALLAGLTPLAFSCKAAQMPEKKTTTLSDGVEQTIDESSLPKPSKTAWVFRPEGATNVMFADTLTRSISTPQAPLALPMKSHQAKIARLKNTENVLALSKHGLKPLKVTPPLLKVLWLRK